MPPRQRARHARKVGRKEGARGEGNFQSLALCTAAADAAFLLSLLDQIDWEELVATITSSASMKRQILRASATITHRLFLVAPSFFHHSRLCCQARESLPCRPPLARSTTRRTDGDVAISAWAVLPPSAPVRPSLHDGEQGAHGAEAEGAVQNRKTCFAPSTKVSF